MSRKHHNTYATIGRNIRRLREEQGMSRPQLVKACGYDCGQGRTGENHIAKVEDARATRAAIIHRSGEAVKHRTCAYCGNPYGNGHSLRCAVTKMGWPEQWANNYAPTPAAPRPPEVPSDARREPVDPDRWARLFINEMSSPVSSDLDNLKRSGVTAWLSHAYSAGRAERTAELLVPATPAAPRPTEAIKRPRMIVLAPSDKTRIENPDAISFQTTVWNEPWKPAGGDELRFVELTPELLAWLRAQLWVSAAPAAPKHGYSLSEGLHATPAAPRPTEVERDADREYGPDGSERYLTPASVESDGARVHHLKCWPAPYAAMVAGKKTFEFRKWDRDYRVGDVLLLNEYNPETKNRGGLIWREVTYLLPGGSFGLPLGYCVMGLAKPVPDCPETAERVPECGMCGLLGTFATSVRVREDGTTRCNACWAVETGSEG